MYKIIGGDHKEYGPVSADEIRRWLAEGRLNGQSLIRLDSGAEWKPLASFPEFAPDFNAGAQPPQLPAGVPQAPQAFTAQILAGTPHVAVGSCLARSVALLKANFGLLFAACFVVWIFNVAASFTPLGLGLIVYFLFKGVLYGGLYYVFLKRIRGEPASIADVFAGFKSNIIQLMLAGMVSGILIWVGTTPCCLILPGVYLLIAWLFAIPLVIDRTLEFWSAMELSRKVITRVWFEMLALALVAFLPLVLASIFVQCKIILQSIPVVQDIMGSGQIDFKQVLERVSQLNSQTQQATRPLEWILKGIWLLNWPFALGALAYAYEDLFGARKSQGT
jgi:hypothetical protein